MNRETLVLLLDFAAQHGFGLFVFTCVLCGALFWCLVVCVDLAKAMGGEKHIHHHHGRGCQKDHERGPCPKS